MVYEDTRCGDECPEWPERYIDGIHPIVNCFDNCGQAYAITLSCGHTCYLTGSAVVNRRHVHCRTCWLGRS